MEAERNRRKQLLDTQAQINVAEGQKQRVILESEGHVWIIDLSLWIPSNTFFYLQLEAKSNEADAAYKTVFREAEARCVSHYSHISMTDIFSLRFTVNSSP